MKRSEPNQLSEPWWSNVQSKKVPNSKEIILLLDCINQEDQFNAKIIIYTQPVGYNLMHNYIQ